MTNSLRSKTLHALSWSFIEAAGLQGVRFIIGIVLARLLLPEQFGLIAMLMIFMAVAESLLDSGFGSALIQKREITQLDTCSIFYFNIIVGLIVSGLLCLCAPLIAAFYNQPILSSLTQALSLTIVINAFGVIQRTILTKQIDFKTQTKVSLFAVVLSGLIGISMATFGFGVWSLVIQQVSSALFRTISLWFFSPWRPALIFSTKALQKMFGFGSRLLLSDLLNRIFDNIYLLIVGKLFSAAELGFFERSKNFQELPSNTLTGMFSRVTFPVFSTIQDDPVRLKRGLKKALTAMVLVNFPIMIGLAAIASPLVLILLTEKWGPCIPYLQLFCVVGMLLPLHVINLNVLQVLGRSDLFLRLEIAKKVLIIINIVVTWRWGISAMIHGIIIVSIISYYLNSYYTGVLIRYRIWEQFRDLFPYLITAMLMGIIVYVVGLPPVSPHWVMILVQITTGIVAYVCLCWLFRLTTFMDIWHSGLNNLPFLKPGMEG